MGFRMPVWVLLGSVCAPSQTAAPVKTKPDYSQEAVIVEQLSTKIVFEGDGTSKQDSTTRIRMQSDAGVQQFGVLNIPYAKANGDVEIVYVRVRKPDGSVVVTPEENVQEMPAAITREAPFYSDLREKHVAVRGLGVGDTLEFQVRSALTKPQVPGQFWYEHNFVKDAITKDEQIEISVPKDKYVKVRSPEVQPTVRDEGPRRLYTWKTANLELKTKDVKKGQQKAAKGETPPYSVEITTFRSWEEIGRWFGDLQRDRIAVTPEIRTKALEVTKGLTNDADKLQAIYRYVSSQFRYVGLAFGIGRYQPHAASDVLANEYGDCKDKHTLFAALLSAVGIQALPALVNASRQIDPESPSPSQFDHLISVVQQGKELVWLDTTSEVAPFGLITANVRDKDALVIFADHPPALMRTPANPPFPTAMTFETEGKLASDGVLTARIDRSTRGDLELLLRLAYRRTPQSQWQELTQRVSYMSNFAGEVSNIDVSSPEDTTRPFHLAYDYTRKDYPDWQNRSINPPIPPLLTPLGDDDKWTEDAFLGAPGEIIYRAKVELPKGYNAAKIAPVDLKTDFAEYHATYRTAPGSLSVERRLTITRGKITESDWEAYRKFCKQVGDDRDRMVDVYSGEYGPVIASGQNTGNIEADRLFDRARQAMSVNEAATAKGYLEQLLKMDPTHRDAWTVMAFVRLMKNDLDGAFEAFNKEIANHPDSVRAYQALADTQVRTRHPREAIETWRRLLKVSPDDHDAVRNLGQLLVSEKQYAEAIEYLEKAGQNEPENANVQLSLGNAYLEHGDKAKGIAKLEKAAELDSSPNTLNNVAYSLADAQLELPRALEYGKKAVAAVESETEKTTLATLKTSDLTRMGLLAAYWDTLGWVYYRSNELEKAESYLKAAWALSQRGTEADHLGQMYEKQGNLKSAAHLYELALGSGAEQETRKRLERIRGKAPAPSSRPEPSKKAGGPAHWITVGPGEELSRMRTTKIGRVAGIKSGSAEFFILLRDGGKVDEVKFVSGQEELRNAEKAIAATHFDQPLPSGSGARIVRRGFLSCSQYTAGCDFVVLTLDMVRSVQ